MPDEPQRPTPGQQSDPRPAAGAPEWWSALGRADLPDGDESPGSPPAAITPPSRWRRLRGAHWRVWAFNAAVLLAAVLVICLGVGVISLSMFLTVALLFGVPLAAAAGATTVVARRSR